MGTGFPAALRAAGFVLEVHDDHFPQKTTDVDWIVPVTELGWIILTKDKSIGRDDREIDTLMIAGGRAYIPAGQMHPSEFSNLLITSRTRLDRHLRQQEKHNRGPYMAKLRRDLKDASKPGSVETWIDREKWEAKIAQRVTRRRT